MDPGWLIYGTGMAAHNGVRGILRTVCASLPVIKIFFRFTVWYANVVRVQNAGRGMTEHG